MRRRTLLKGVLAAAAPGFHLPLADATGHQGKLFVFVQAGNIPYAPFANNTAFFEKYHSRMLVINGVDAQTNSHTVGIVHDWSGRTAEGYLEIKGCPA